MSRNHDTLARLCCLWAAQPALEESADYTLVARFGAAYAAWSREGAPALVMPVEGLAGAPVGRRASGCELKGYSSTRFLFDGSDSVGSAAALICNDPDLVDVFAVLALDVAGRTREGEATWSGILTSVEDWQTLLAPRGQANAGRESGLWGELWFILQGDDVDALLAGWRGPEGDTTDFFVGGRSVEVKTARRRREHHVSLSQVDAPVGTCEAWLLSIWVKEDPAATRTVADLVDAIMSRTMDRGEALRRIARAGYSPLERRCYTTAYALLAPPEWYAVETVPRVRLADPGVSHIRYRVTLDQTWRTDGPPADALWRHFHGRDYGGETR